MTTARGTHRTKPIIADAIGVLAVVLAFAGCTSAPTEPAPSDAPATSEEELAWTSPDLGSADWLRRTGGHLTVAEKWAAVAQAPRALESGLLLEPPSDLDFSRFAPPRTEMVLAAEAFARAHQVTEMVNHCYRTAYWTLFVMSRIGAVTDDDIETAWVAALLHDIGLEQPRGDGTDFSLVGVDATRALAAKHQWPEAKVSVAEDAIALNTNTWIDRARFGLVPWAMQIGGSAEVAHTPFRLLMTRESLARLESESEGMHARGRMRETGNALIREEAERVPDGRFALLTRLGFLHLTR